MNRGALTSPLFLGAVATLLVNDFVLKTIAPGVVTGKLSDFAGLFAFAVFFGALVPAHRLMVNVLTGFAFILWKSPLAQPLLDALPFLGRTVDATDLLALAVLPFAYRHAGRSFPSRRGVTASIAIAAFAFAATSYRTEVNVDREYLYDGTPAQFVEKLRAMEATVWEESGKYTLTIPAPGVCFDSLDAEVR
ncbi:MAG: hypothetical protein ACLGH0_12680, partial [Thermoanaerobaculia bacterium]